MYSYVFLGITCWPVKEIRIVRDSTLCSEKGELLVPEAGHLPQLVALANQPRKTYPECWVVWTVTMSWMPVQDLCMLLQLRSRLAVTVEDGTKRIYSSCNLLYCFWRQASHRGCVHLYNTGWDECTHCHGCWKTMQ